MSALTPRGPAWVAIRQHRLLLWTAPLLVVVPMALLVVARVRADSAKTTANCGRTWNEACDVYSKAIGWYSWAENYLGLTVILLLPLLVAAFTAGPLIARELESGTYRLAWTQSVSPARWLAIRLAGPAAVAVAGSVLLILAFRWSRSYTRADWYPTLGWSGREVYPAMGLSGVAHVLLTVGIGALAAVLVRRTLLAVGAGVLATGGVVLAFAWVRPYLWPVVTAEGNAAVRRVDGLSDPWIVHDGFILADGSRITREQCWNMGLSKSPCHPDAANVTPFFEYHPTSHFWPLQLVETGIVLLLAAGCVFAAFKVLRRIHA